MAKKTTVPSKTNKTATGSQPIQQRVLTGDQIGEVAGEVWQLLADESNQTLAAIKKSIDAPADLVMASIGWLAREGKLEFRRSGRSVKVALR